MAVITINSTGYRVIALTESSGGTGTSNNPTRITADWSHSNPIGSVTNPRWTGLAYDFSTSAILNSIPNANITGISFGVSALNERFSYNDRHSIITLVQAKTSSIPSWTSIKNSGQSRSITAGYSQTFWFSNSTSWLSNLKGNNLSLLVTPGMPDNSLTDYDFFGTTNGYVNVPYTLYFGVGGSAQVQITYTQLKPNPPIALVPDGSSRNPLEDITLSWYFNPQVIDGITPDTQKSAEIRYRKNSGSWSTDTITGSNPSYNLSVAGLVDDDIIEWQVRAEGVVHGWSDWSAIATFDIAPTPPLPPLLNYPLSSLNASAGILFEWTYRSDVDVIPTGFDFAYKLDGADWVQTHIPGSLDTPANSFYFLDISIVLALPFTWRVRSYGELGSVSDWSKEVSFDTIGAPPPPTIIRIIEVSRPTIFFNATNLISYEIEILQAQTVIYSSGVQSFESVFNYRLNDFLSNGQYLCRLRVVNTFGYTSQWALKSFYINVPSITGTTIRNVSRMPKSIRLYLADTVKAYIYRDDLRIAEINSNVFDDFTCAPNKTYNYFVRVFDGDSFADSNIVKAETDFFETLIADVENLSDPVILSKALNAKPRKSSSFNTEKAVLSFSGRKSPVVEMADTEFRQLDYTFYCDALTVKRLEDMHVSEHTLLLRDKRFGAIFGTISTPVRADAVQEGFNVSFSFLETDYDKEIQL